MAPSWRAIILFSVDEIANLLSLWRDRARPSRDVKSIADEHVAELEARIAEMQAMADTLRHLSGCCAGDDRPDCPILASGQPAAAVRPSAVRRFGG